MCLVSSGGGWHCHKFYECVYLSDSRSIVLLSAEVFLQLLSLFSRRGSRLYSNTACTAGMGPQNMHVFCMENQLCWHVYMTIAFSKDLASNMVHNIEYRGRGVNCCIKYRGAPTLTLFPTYSAGFPTYKLSVQLKTVKLLSIRRY